MLATCRSLAPPYGARGSNVPYTAWKNQSHNASLIAGAARKAAACAIRRLNGSTRPAGHALRPSVTTPMATASSAYRVCSHGSNATAAPTARQRPTPGGAGSTRFHTATITTNAAALSG